MTVQAWETQIKALGLVRRLGEIEQVAELNPRLVTDHTKVDSQATQEDGQLKVPCPLLLPFNVYIL